MTETNNNLPTDYQSFIHKSRYARYLPEEKRRETWVETVDRLVNFWDGRYPEELKETLPEIREAILDLEIMPSMRSLMTAGKALDRDEVAGFNCAYVAVDNARVFDEIMYVLMCGTGVGFSCERQYTNKLPDLPENLHESGNRIVVRDSKIGWATAFRALISLLYSGEIPEWDMHKVRPAGAPLKTFGGRASGPEPLADLFRYTVELFQKHYEGGQLVTSNKLNSLEVHGLVCKIAEIVVVGGVRRSALISLSNLSDGRMRHAKSGQWWVDHPEHALANNSVCYTETPDAETFMREWLALVESKSGERGIFSRVAARALTREANMNRSKIGIKNLRDADQDFGCNPCSEILLRSKQFCNLTEVVVRPSDTLETLLRKVRLAAILGTLQASLTNFRYLTKQWSVNTAEEALLGVSLTGIMDHPILNGSLEVTEDFDPDFESDGTLKGVLNLLRDYAISVNTLWSTAIGVNASKAITCVNKLAPTLGN